MTTMAEYPPIQPGLFTEDETPQLLGGRCSRCDSYHFPAPEICPCCLGPMERTGLGARATLYSFTTIRTKPPLGLPKPYRVGYVDLEKVPLRIFALLDPNQSHGLEIGQKLQLRTAPLGVNLEGCVCLRPFFVAADSQD